MRRPVAHLRSVVYASTLVASAAQNMRHAVGPDDRLIANVRSTAAASSGRKGVAANHTNQVYSLGQALMERDTSEA